jgi:Ca2+-binding EF-hand superfamily protein
MSRKAKPKLDDVFSSTPPNLTKHHHQPKKNHLLSEAFDLFDTDGSGAIDAKELTVAMR